MITLFVSSTIYLLDALMRSEADMPSKNLIKTWNVIEYIELDIQNIKALKIDDPIDNSKNYHITYSIKHVYLAYFGLFKLL